MIQAHIDDEKFDATALALETAHRERLTMAFPDLFAHCVTLAKCETTPIGPPKPQRAAPPQEKPARARKPREAKAPSGDAVAHAADVLAFLKRNNGSRPADIDVKLFPEERKAAIKVLLNEGKVRCEGKAGGARYYVVDAADEGDA